MNNDTDCALCGLTDVHAIHTDEETPGYHDFVAEPDSTNDVLCDCQHCRN